MSLTDLEGNTPGSMSDITDKSFMLRMRAQVPDGHVILGQGGPEAETYVTRYRIEHPQQRSSLCRETLHGDCIPCCSPKHSAPWRTALVAAIRSEILLFSLHMFTIFLGVLKGEVSDIHKSEVLHLVHSCLETAVTIFLIAVRLSSAWIEYREFKKEICENISHADPRHIEGRSIRNWLAVYTVFCVILEVICVATLLAFHFTENLGWTVLVNQFSLIVILSISGLFVARIELARVRNMEDEFKTLIHEEALIITEIIQERSTQQSTKALNRGKRFTKAFKNSPKLKLPAYINIVDVEDSIASETTEEGTPTDAGQPVYSFTGLKATSL